MNTRGSLLQMPYKLNSRIEYYLKYRLPILDYKILNILQTCPLRACSKYGIAQTKCNIILKMPLLTYLMHLD